MPVSSDLPAENSNRPFSSAVSRRVTARACPRSSTGWTSICLPTSSGRSLHDISELAGQDQVPLASHERGLDEHDVAAGGCVVHAGRDADLVLSRHLLRM